MGDVAELARGKWKGILPALGIPSKLTNGKNQPCPFCGGKDRFRFTDFQGRGGYICSKCESGSGFDLLMRLKNWDFKTAAEEVEKVLGSCRRTPERSEIDKRKAMNDLWVRAHRINERDPVGIYLGKRCGLTAFPGSLRGVPLLRYSGSSDSFPAMLAKLTKTDGSPCNIHRTYLTTDGRKASVEAPRRMMPGSVAKGSAVRLAPEAECMGIAEGIETALSASVLFGIPVWSALNAEGLRSWEPPTIARKIMIFGDNDESFTGQHAAFALARRLTTDGIKAEIHIPPTIGQDFNDVLSASRKEAA